MNNRFIIAVSAVVAVALVAVLSLVLIKPSSTDEPSPADAIAMAAERDAQEQARAAASEVAAEAAETERQQEEAEEMAASERSSVVALPPYDDDDEFASPFAEFDLFDEEVVEELLKEYGSIAAIYELANKEEREDLIDMLMGEERLRDEIASLLVDETDPDLRLYMIDRVDPKHFYDDSDDYDDFVDKELLDLLNEPTKTPITEDEWLARMDLAHLIDDEQGLDWARRGMRAYPDSDEVQLLGNVIKLNVAASVENAVPSGEAQQAMEFVYGSVFGEEAIQRFDPFDRMQAYNSVYAFDPQGAIDPQRSLDYYRAQMQYETDPRALDMLMSLETRLLNRYGDQLAINTNGDEDQ